MNRPSSLHQRAALSYCGLLLLASGLVAQSPTQLSVRLEVGPTWQSRNDVQIPNDDSGDRFSLTDIAEAGPWLSPRLEINWRVRSKQELRVLLAPLSYTETGTLTLPVDFVGETFLPELPTEATYRFNSWRLTYRFRAFESDRWTWWVGGTAKVRDAKVQLRQSVKQAADSNVGFVPLLHVAGTWRWAERWQLAMDLDALAGGPGRAVDLGLAIGVDLNDRWTLAAGYRTLEGGADTDTVHSFAWFHTAYLSTTYRF